MKYRVLIFLVLIAIATGCKKTVDPPVVHTAGWDERTVVNSDIRTFLSDQAGLAQTFAIDPNVKNILTTARGIRLTIEKNTFYNQSGVLETTVPTTLTIFEYLTNRDLITGNVNTTNEPKNLFFTDGIFKIYASGKLGQELSIRGAIVIECPNNTVRQEDKIFTGDEHIYALLNRISWKQDTVTLTNVLTGFDFPLRSTAWCGFGRVPDDGAHGSATFTVKLPLGFGNQNSVSFLLLPNHGALQLAAETTSEIFTTGAYQVPVGQPVKVFTIGYKDAQFSYNLQSTTVAAGQQLMVDSMQAVSRGNLENVIAYSLD